MSNRLKTERNRQITLHILNGETITKVAEDYKLSYNRARTIVYETIARDLKFNLRNLNKISLNAIRYSKNYIIERLI